MPILISTPQELSDIRNNLSGDYELANDIDMSGWGNWTPISTYASSFSGSLDGKGYKIQNVTINTSERYASFLGYSNGTIVRNLGLTDINLYSSEHYVGGLIGYGLNTTVEECYVTGVVSGKSGTSQYIGGLIGRLKNGLIKNSYSSAHVTNGLQRVGGFSGGAVVSEGSQIENCYSNGLVDNIDNAIQVGGFLGFGSLESNTNYWDIETSGQTTSIGNEIPKTTAEMKTQSTYDSWDFVTTWGMNGDYPYLQAFGTPEATIPEPVVGTRTPTSQVSPIYSNVSISVILPPTTENRQVKSYLLSAHSSTEVYRSVLRRVMTNLSPLYTNVHIDVSSPNNNIVNINSYVNPIHSDIITKTKKYVNVLSHIGRLRAFSDAFKALEDIPIIGYVSVECGRSQTQVEYNQTINTVNYNLSSSEVIK